METTENPSSSRSSIVTKIGFGSAPFFYQKRRIEPSTGTVVIWPGGFTHTHKGNLVLKGTKYVITGWFYQQPV